MTLGTLNYSETYTVNDAAGRYSRTTARIRQICIEHGIGTLIEGRIRLLSIDDLRLIGKIIAETGRQKS